jgi:hypothetical protein
MVEVEMEKVFVVKRVAERLWATEDAVDAAIAKTSMLMAGVVEAREELKVSHSLADPTMLKLAEALKAMADARHAVIEAHKALDEAKLRIGVRTKLEGDPGKVWNMAPATDESLERKAS